MGGLMQIDIPSPDQAIENGAFTTQWVNFITKVKNYISGNSQSGTTAQRPTSNLEIGTKYYDTTLGYPVFVHQVKPTVVWHNAAGAVV
jgi:hypothetical protein